MFYFFKAVQPTLYKVVKQLDMAYRYDRRPVPSILPITIESEIVMQTNVVRPIQHCMEMMQL